MNIAEETCIPLEILIATMNRNSLDFLDDMFRRADISQCHVLIINQTTQDILLESNKPNIRVINSFEKGLSKSRNLAIQNAMGDICLLADDDIIYLEGFNQTILQSYSSNKKADLITFKTLSTESIPYSNYPRELGKLGSFCKYVLSIELSFKLKSIVDAKVRFNENFGLGATYMDSENYVFLKDVMAIKNFRLLFVPEFVVIHKPFSSSDDIASDRHVFGRSALNYKFYGNAAYIYIVKLIFFLLRKKLIKFEEISHKFKVAHLGINSYKNIHVNCSDEK